MASFITYKNVQILAQTPKGSAGQILNNNFKNIADVLEQLTVDVEGASGFSGYSGSGYSGYSGLGLSGYSGYSSTSGYSGPSGYSGYSSTSGYSGYSGRSGYSGYSAYSGYSGRSGYSGYSAYSGYSGISGYSGYSGRSGYSGYSGYSSLSGYSGYSASSGYSGYSGTVDGSVESIVFGIDGGGGPITTGSKLYRIIDFSGTITGWTIVSDQTGSIVLDIKRATYSDFPTTTSIAGSEKPTLSSARKNQDNSLSTWTTSLSAGDILEFVVDSVSAVEKVVVSIKTTR